MIAAQMLPTYPLWGTSAIKFTNGTMVHWYDGTLQHDVASLAIA